MFWIKQKEGKYIFSLFFTVIHILGYYFSGSNSIVLNRAQTSPIKAQKSPK